jgi:hypothetical protein
LPLRKHLAEGQLDTINVMPCPLTVLPDQLAYIHFTTLTIQNALKRLPELYFQDLRVHDLLHPSVQALPISASLGCFARDLAILFDRFQEGLVRFLPLVGGDAAAADAPELLDGANAPQGALA